MRGQGWIAVVVVASLTAGHAEALVLCAAKGKGTAPKEGAAPKLRTACKAKEVQLDPAALGLQGPQGPAGTNGTDGAAGAPGISGLEVNSANSGDVIQTTFQTVSHDGESLGREEGHRGRRRVGERRRRHAVGDGRAREPARDGLLSRRMVRLHLGDVDGRLARQGLRDLRERDALRGRAGSVTGRSARGRRQR